MNIPIISPGQISESAKTSSKSSSKLSSIKILPKGAVVELPSKVSRGPTGPRSVIPTGDTCCTKACTIINRKVEFLKNELRLREEEFSYVREGMLAGTRKVVVPKKGELEKSKKFPSRKVETEEIEQEIRYGVEFGESRRRLRRQINSITDQLTSLQDLRYEMVEKGSCKCIEEVKSIDTAQILKVPTITKP